MPTHSEKRNLPYTPAQLFALVSGVEHYPEFLPWCVASRITKREGDAFYADLVIGYKMVRETFSSKVTALRPDHIHVEYMKGPMRHLSNHWRFIEEPDGSCTIDFYVDFDFKNPLLQGVITTFFHEAVKRMVDAFEKRAEFLYGKRRNG
ncbi:MAG: type II toxin-antitoxin system RatA family toxin [Alphaproteobacteria bacterium]|nr:type II toxin-antitoxin system RatA family toxin [Alphaproteobacteria bacterium]